MKRTPLARRTSLRRTPGPAPTLGSETPGKPTPRRVVAVEAPGREAWNAFKHWGPCENCGEYGLRDPHHVVQVQYIERYAPGRIYDLADRMLLGRRCCHPAHHTYGTNDTRLPRGCVPDAAIAFAVDLFGSKWRADDYFARHYRP